MKRALSSTLLLAITSTLTIGMAVPAEAAELSKNETERQISQSLEVLETLESYGNIEASVDSYPTVATDGNSSELQNGSVGLKTNSGGATYVEGKVATVADDHNIIYENLQSGDSRAVIQIDSPDAPTAYSFEMTGEYTSLVMREDGGIDALDANSNIVASVDAPWAYDADGDAVPTHFIIDGNTITQVVEHNESFDYGIVADPTLREHIKKVIAGCLGVQPGTFTVWGVLEATFKSWDKAVKFLVRRIGVLGAVTCLGGIVYQYL